MPLLILGLARLGVVTARGLIRASRYVIAAAFILGAVLTPPDVLTQSMMAGVLIVLYFGSVILAAIFGKKRPVETKTDDPHADAPPTEDQRVDS
jgi:sec-independent protein translocase protein TatC